MKKSRISPRRISLVLVVAVLAALTFYVGIPTKDTRAHAGRLSDALTNARSVTLIEFERDVFGPELIFTRVSATPQQIAAIRSAAGAWFAPIPRWQMMCFEPHHRVEIFRADGSVLRMDICFHCQNFTLGEPHAITMPALWSFRLSRFFTSVGMPPRDDYSALAKNHPDYHLVEEAQRKLDEQIEQLDKAPQK